MEVRSCAGGTTRAHQVLLSRLSPRACPNSSAQQPTQARYWGISSAFRHCHLDMLVTLIPGAHPRKQLPEMNTSCACPMPLAVLHLV